jgi:hypothetical protein
MNELFTLQPGSNMFILPWNRGYAFLPLAALLTQILPVPQGLLYSECSVKVWKWNLECANEWEDYIMFQTPNDLASAPFWSPVLSISCRFPSVAPVAWFPLCPTFCMHMLGGGVHCMPPQGTGLRPGSGQAARRWASNGSDIRSSPCGLGKRCLFVGCAYSLHFISGKVEDVRTLEITVQGWKKSREGNWGSTRKYGRA